MTIGKTRVIKGWAEGREARRLAASQLIIPPDLGYGMMPDGTIPKNATLIFEIEILSEVGKNFGSGSNLATSQSISSANNGTTLSGSRR